ncbi:DUF4123 domain-containing protein [Burkholderia gladioli]|uniref:DUF4123 domain-containing protein n=1 Tax=Burkholderia gladioli TaxID=28095 RepID=UPI00163FBBAD|nr:DUF4123 domain-containing protein [Burkholderia gladioli]
MNPPLMQPVSDLTNGPTRGFLLIDPSTCGHAPDIAALDGQACTPRILAHREEWMPKLVDLATLNDDVRMLAGRYLLGRLHADQPPAICAWLDSEASVDVIAGHIAHHLVGPGIGGQSVFWRFHDPRVFSLALAILDPAQRRALLGPVKSWTFPWAGHGWRVEAGQFAHESVDSPAGWPRPDQWPRIDRSAMAHEVCYRLAGLSSAQAARLPVIVDELFREALNQGLVASHEFVTFALQRLPHDFKLA